MLTEEQLALREAVASVLAAESDPWPKLCTEIGVAALEIPERYGGFEATPIETHLVLEELGKTLAPNPMLGSVILAGGALLASGDDSACARLLPELASGSFTAALAWTDERGGWSTDVVPLRAESGTLSGTAHYVLDGARADVLLAIAETADGIGLFELERETSAVEVSTMDETRQLATLTLDRAPASRIGGDFRESLAWLRDRACLAISAEQLGAASHCLEATVEYCKQRVQFERPIGGFQAIKHRLADAYVLLESARSASYAAAGEPDPVNAAIAKAHCSEAFSAIVAEMVQLHGGIAITWEHEAHRYFKRAHGDALLFGEPATQLSRLAEQWLGCV